MIDDTVMFIMEYAVVDSLGRSKGWHYAGVTTDAERARTLREAIIAENAPRKVEFRASRYSHALGNNA
jgi:hypothetical protein